MSATSLILTGFFFLLLGVVLPFLMVIHLLESTFFLNFFAYTISVIGLILGIVGVARFGGASRK